MYSWLIRWWRSCVGYGDAQFRQQLNDFAAEPGVGIVPVQLPAIRPLRAQKRKP